MKILLISPTLKGIGGVAQHVRDLIKFLKENGHHVDVLSSENTPVIPIKKLKNPSFLISSFLKAKLMKPYDIVHAQHPIAALAMKNISGKKILTIHGIYSEQIGMLHGQSSSNFSNKYEKNAFEWADAVTAGSKEAFEYYSKLGPKVTFIPNAIDIKSIPSGIDTRYEKQIIFAGRLSKEKGILTILETAKNLPKDIHLLIVGDGPEKETVTESIKTNKNIHYLGYQPKEKTIPLIRGSKLLIQPSLAEGISATLLEAMACKTPVIATAIGGNVELFENNKTGILIEPNSSVELLNSINSIIHNTEKLQKLSNNAFELVQEYDWSNIGKKYLELYKKLTQS
ncbi:glycosyltransferase family 4 protein [Nitrosopumilus adriaticus]|uniref:Glycosyl transferase group 1 n=1 Tax=Nitrosopumilus adriaticus TaxID=1580092 RepID=A0A0D5C655_9ARCH|nr:glycosyltransferase family 4 protein [Nitrosopumilus adriaticus]AJW71830.1 Glycosyl transferase group 1 [Nitrosopumilus adriaticus]